MMIHNQNKNNRVFPWNVFQKNYSLLYTALEADRYSQQRKHSFFLKCIQNHKNWYTEAKIDEDPQQRQQQQSLFLKHIQKPHNMLNTVLKDGSKEGATGTLRSLRPFGLVLWLDFIGLKERLKIVPSDSWLTSVTQVSRISPLCLR